MAVIHFDNRIINLDTGIVVVFTSSGLEKGELTCIPGIQLYSMHVPDESCVENITFRSHAKKTHDEAKEFARKKTVQMFSSERQVFLTNPHSKDENIK